MPKLNVIRLSSELEVVPKEMMIIFSIRNRVVDLYHYNDFLKYKFLLIF